MINISFPKENVKELFENAKLFEDAKIFVKLVEEPSLINIDRYDLRLLLEKCDGKIMLVTGRAEGRNMLHKAVRQALKTAQGIDLSKVSGVIFAFTGGSNMLLSDVHLAAEEACRNLKTDAEVLWGAGVDQELKNSVKVYLMFFGGGVMK